MISGLFNDLGIVLEFDIGIEVDPPVRSVKIGAWKIMRFQLQRAEDQAFIPGPQTRANTLVQVALLRGFRRAVSSK